MAEACFACDGEIICEGGGEVVQLSCRVETVSVSRRYLARNLISLGMTWGSSHLEAVSGKRSSLGTSETLRASESP